MIEISVKCDFCGRYIDENVFYELHLFYVDNDVEMRGDKDIHICEDCYDKYLFDVVGHIEYKLEEFDEDIE